MRGHFLVGMGLAVLMGACASPGRVDTETAPGADFTQRRTFAWQESQASYAPQAAKPEEVEKVKTAIHDAVLAQLDQKGYRFTSGETADFLVSYHLVVTEFQSPDLCIRRQAIFEWPGSVAPIDTYEICRTDPVMSRRTLRKGTLVIFVVDAGTHNLLWQGVADGGVGSRPDQIDKLRDAVERMFLTFPAHSA